MTALSSSLLCDRGLHELPSGPVWDAAGELVRTVPVQRRVGGVGTIAGILGRPEREAASTEISSSRDLSEFVDGFSKVGR